MIGSLRASRGFSLVEMLMALAIAAILLGVAVPGLRELIRRQQIHAAVGDLFAAMRLARSEAMQRGRRVDLVPADGQSWTSGWIVFIDENGNHRPDGGDRIVFAHQAVARDIGIVAALSDSDSQYLAYNGAGRTRTNDSNDAPQLGTWSFSVDGKVRRRIKIGFLGRPRVCDPDADSTCTGTGST